MKTTTGNLQSAGETFKIDDLTIKLGVLQKRHIKEHNSLISTIKFFLDSPSGRKEATLNANFHYSFLYFRIKPHEKLIKTKYKHILNDVIVVIDVPDVVCKCKNSGRKKGGQCEVEIYFNFKEPFRYLFNNRSNIPQVHLAETITLEFIIDLQKYINEVYEEYLKLLKQNNV